MSVTLEQLEAVSDEHLLMLVKDTDFAKGIAEETGHPLRITDIEFKLYARVTLLKAYVAGRQLDPKDLPFVAVLQRYPSSPIHLAILRTASITDASIAPLIPTLKDEKLAVYMAMRAYAHLTTAIRKAWGTAVERKVDAEVGQITPELIDFKVLSGLTLVADLKTAAPGVLGRWSSEHTGTLTPGGDVSAQYSKVWSTVLADPHISTEAYAMMRSYYLQLVYKSESKSPSLAPQDLILGFGASITAHFEHGLLKLPPKAASYLQYVARLLINYKHYGVVGLRLSDCSSKDPIFKAVSGRVPTDAEVLARLVAF